MDGRLPEDEQERRKFARISNHFLVRSCKAEHASMDPEKIIGIVRDINFRGLAFLTNQDYRVNDKLELEIELVGFKGPGGTAGGLLNSAAITTQATVARTENFGPGFSLVAALFDSLEKEDEDLLARALSYQQAMDAA